MMTAGNQWKSRMTGPGLHETDGRCGWVYLAVQLGHLSGQSNVWAVDQRTSTAGLLTGLVTVADLIETRPNKNQWTMYKLQWS